MMKLKENKGFTLIELLLVIVIIGIMLAVIVPRAWRANIDAKYGLTRQNCSELASFAQQWAEKSIAAQDETASTATLNAYFVSLCATNSPTTLSTAYNWVARANNWNWNNNGGQYAVPGRLINGSPAVPEDSVEDITPPDKIPRNPFNGVSVYETPNDPHTALNPVTGAIACAGIQESATTGWCYYALIFQGTDNSGYAAAGDFHAGQARGDLAGLRNGVFLARLR